MDAPTTTDSFTLLSTPMYGTWDSSINPKAYFEKRYQVTTHTIHDDRPYSIDVVKHLEKNGAKLITSHTNISDMSRPQADDMLRMFSTDEASSFSFWYKTNIVLVNRSEDGTYTINVDYPDGVPHVHEEFKEFLIKRKAAAVGVLMTTMHGGLTVKNVDFAAPVIDDLDLNYGTGFKEKIYDKLVAKLEKPRSGLALLHGFPGTGKSMLIKHLTTKIDRPFIFIPIAMAGELGSPSFIRLLMGYAGAILVLEDAEQALQSREKDFWNSAVVSTILNLSDGLMGNVLNVSILATYNADKQTIDKALLRKGRLIYDYSFSNLSVEDSNRLARHLKKKGTFSEPTSLADIYNMEDDTNYVPPVTKTMGFGFVAPTPK